MKIRYEIIHKPAALKPGASKDMSGTGIRLALEEKIEAGSALKLQIELPYEKGKIVTVYGEVVWVRKVEITAIAKSSKYYETGIRFTKADSLTLGRIFKHFQTYKDER
jgi:hypothetical protein